MKEVNRYYNELSDEQIHSDYHRGFIGGFWELLGKLQLDFLRDQGLSSTHRLLDIGCGSLRAGIHFIDFLDEGGYYGTDINASLVKAAHVEIDKASLTEKKATVVVDRNFDLDQFGVQFDFAIAQSVFTHLYANHIIHCLIKTRTVLAPGGRFYASFLEAPTSGWIEDIQHQPGNVISHYDSDPFHYSVEEFELFAKLAGMKLDYIGDWSHPRDAKMLCFTSL